MKLKGILIISFFLIMLDSLWLSFTVLHIPFNCAWIGYILIFYAIKQSEYRPSEGIVLILKIGLVVNLLQQPLLIYNNFIVWAITMLFGALYNNIVVMSLIHDWGIKCRRNIPRYLYYYQLAYFITLLLWKGCYDQVYGIILLIFSLIFELAFLWTLSSLIREET